MFRKLAFGTALLLLCMLCVSTFAPGQARAFDGDYKMRATLSNQPSDANLVEVVGHRESNNLNPRDVTFQWKGSFWETNTIDRTNPDICNSPDYPGQPNLECTWTIRVKEKSTGSVVGSAGPEKVQGSTLTGNVAKTWSIAVPVLGAPATTGTIEGRLTFVDYVAEPDVADMPVPPNVPIRITQTAGGSYTAETFTTSCNNDRIRAKEADCGKFVFRNVPPGTYTLRASGGWVDGSKTIPITIEQAGIAVVAGQTTSANANQPSPGGTAPPTDTETVEKEDTCEGQIKTVGWLACPLILTASEASQWLGSQIVSLLKIDTATIFDTSQHAETSNAYYNAWSGFRNISYVILIIIGLVMVASQVFNIELLSAYTLRKMLPSLIIAVIFVTLSWEIMEFLYTLANDAADAVMEIIRLPFNDVGSVKAAIGAGQSQSLDALGPAIADISKFVGLGTAGGAVVLTYAALGGWMVVLSLLLSVALFVLSVFVLLAARDVVAFLLVILAPIAIMCAAFEPLKKGFSFWRGLVVAILVSIPGVAAILTITGVASLIAGAEAHSASATIGAKAISYITAFVILIAGFVMVWTLFLQMDKITGFLGNVASKVTGRAQKALAGYRESTIGRRRQEAIEGQRDMRVAGWNLGRTMRRMSLAGQAGKGGFIGTQNRARLAAAEQAMMQKSAAKRLEEEGGRMSGDDDAMGLAMQAGMTRDRFIREYQTRTGRDGRRALADMEASFGANIGSQAMRVSAAKARWGSVSAYNDFDIDTPEGARNMYRQMMQDAGEMVADGQMSVTDVVTAMKKNTQRMDIAGHSFPQMMQQVSLSADRLRAVRGGATAVNGRVIDEANNDTGVAQATGASVRRSRVQRDAAGNVIGGGQIIGQGANLISNSEIDAWMRGALEYAQPGAIVAGRTETVRILGNQMRERINRSVAAEQQAEAVAAANPNSPAAQQALQNAERETKRQIAALAGRYDVMAQISPENARFMAENVMRHSVPGMDDGTGREINMQQLIERWRGDREFQQYRREYYGASLTGAQQQMAQQAQQAAGIPQQGGLPPQNSDRWLKRDISHVGTAHSGKINLYRFKYLWDDQEYVGVMAQELLCTHPEAVSVGEHGYYQVNYDMLGLPFVTYEEWHTGIVQQAPVKQ